MALRLFCPWPNAGRVLVCAFTLAGLPGDASAGFFEDLFGLSQPEPVAQPSPRQRGFKGSIGVFQERRPGRGAADAQRGKTRVGDDSGAGSKPKKAVFCYDDDAPEKARRADALLHDETLRAGDTVMTAEGFRVFEGRSSACPHVASDFVALSAASLPKAKRSALVEIEHASKRRRHGDDMIDAINKPSLATVAHRTGR